MVTFEIFVKAMPPSLSELKVLPGFCFAFKIPDDRAVTNIYPQIMKLPFCLKLGPNKIETLSPSTFGLTIAKI